MPINTDLNAAPYFDDFDLENQYHRVLFKPGYAVQARELTQLQTMLQSQIEQFGDNIFKEGSIVKGCNFTELDDLQYVRLQDTWIPYDANGVAQAQTGFDPRAYVPQRVTVVAEGVETEFDEIYQLTGETSGLRANVIAADQGVEVRTPDLNTFYINYLNSNETNNYRVFQPGEVLTLSLLRFKAGTQDPAAGQGQAVIQGKVTTTNVVTTTGKSFGIQSAPGIIFQKGHFLFADAQTLVVSKYNNLPNDVNVGYNVQESTIAAINDGSLYDNANGSRNENAPGADRLKLVPSLTVLTSSEAETAADFFTLVRYQNGNAITLRDVSQYNVLGDELARRTYEESGNYVLEKFPLGTDDRIPAGASNTEVYAVLGSGIAYVKGYRVENSADRSFKIDQIVETETVSNQSISFNYGGGYPIDYNNGTNWVSSGTTDIDWHSVILRDPLSSNMGSAVVYNITPTEVYMTGVEVNGGEFGNDIHEIFDSNGAIVFDGDFGVTPGEGGTYQKQSGNEALIFPTGHRSLFSTEKMAIPVRVRENVSGITGNTITINANPGEDFNCNNDEVLVVGSGPSQVRVISVATASNNSQLIIGCNPADSVGSQATVYFNKRLVGSTVDGVSPFDKVVRTPYIRQTWNASQSKYSLGFPDVFDIISITDANGVDVTESFRLISNQKDTYYDISYMEYIPGRPQPTGSMLIQLKVFEISQGSGEYFFTINSYPSTLDLYDIPVYKAKNGSSYNLRECLDFRPYVDKDSNVDYTDDVAAASVPSSAVGDNSKVFTTITPITPARNASATAEITYYLQRVDTVACDSYGGIKLIKGREEKLAAPPTLDPDQMALGHVFVPGYPALSEREASRTGRKAYGVHTKTSGIKAFTMKDMHSLSKQIDRLSYYVSLSQLESSTQNMFIPDELGLNRFKNGFIVDPFNDLTVADVSDPFFKAAVPFNQKILTPALKTFPIDLVYKTSSGASIFPAPSNPKAATLGRDASVEILSQTYATGFRNCVSNAYSYRGVGEISPPYDAAYDTTVNPAEINIDMTAAFTDFVDNLQEFIPLTDVTTERVVGPLETWNDVGPGWAPPRMANWGNWGDFQFPGAGNTFTQRIETTTRSIELNQAAQVQNIQVGEFVRNFNFEPYMAGRDVKIYMSGLRPDARHWFFFDGVDVNPHVFPGTEADRAQDVERTKAGGVEVTTDSNGVLRAVFAIPPETFFVGDRVLEIVDVDTYDQIDSAAISKGFVTYRAYNFSVEKTSVGVSTRAPDFDINTSSSFRNVVRRIPAGDPLAQTFFIKKGMGRGSNSIYISNIDLFFKRKSTTNGVTVELREVVNGYPSGQVLPFGKVHKLPGDVNVSDDASVATTFSFDAPVRMDVEKEYAVSIKPDAQDPNYLAFISQVGGVDLTPGDTQGSAIVQDWGDGVLFSSTNNSAWRSYQDEDLKFTLRRHNFNQSTGSVTLTNNKNEFFTLSGGNGRFKLGEKIYQTKSRDSATTGNLGLSDSGGARVTLTGTALDQTYFDGDYIILEVGGDKDIFRVESVPGATSIIVNKPVNLGAGPTFIDTGIQHSPVVVGEISFWDRNDPTKMHLEASTANSTRFFTTGTINGLDSGFTATIDSVDNINLSYFQPMIMKASDSSSKTSGFGTFNPYDDGSTTYSMPIRFNDNNHFNVRGTILSSASNIVTNPNSTAEFSLTIEMENSGDVTSTPFVDVEVSKMIAYQYQLKDTSAPGYSPLSNPTSMYISKVIELAPELDAEDIYVATTEYRPPGSTVKVYMRAQNQYDSQSFKEVPWVELECFEGSDVNSSISDINDYREFGYRLPENYSGLYQYASNAGLKNFSGFRRFAIKIELISPNVHTAPTLRDYRAIAVT